MTKKFIAFALPVLIVTFSHQWLWGQKLKDKNIAISYVSLPTLPQPPDFKTYSVQAKGGGFETAGINPGQSAKAIKLEGYKRLSGHGKRISDTSGSSSRHPPSVTMIGS